MKPIYFQNITHILHTTNISIIQNMVFYKLYKWTSSLMLHAYVFKCTVVIYDLIFSTTKTYLTRKCPPKQNKKLPFQNCVHPRGCTPASILPTILAQPKNVQGPKFRQPTQHCPSLWTFRTLGKNTTATKRDIWESNWLSAYVKLIMYLFYQ